MQQTAFLFSKYPITFFFTSLHILSNVCRLTGLSTRGKRAFAKQERNAFDQVPNGINSHEDSIKACVECAAVIGYTIDGSGAVWSRVT